MPYRQVPLVSGEVYHIFNRSTAKEPIYRNHFEHQRAYELLGYYRFIKPGIRYSHFKRLNSQEKESFLAQLLFHPHQVEVLAFCFMQNHFHLLLRQVSENGISVFIRNFQNSYAKYFNTKNNRSGAVFQAMFKGVRIETDEQLLHVMRYIHLNPLTSYILKTINELENFKWSSYIDYLNLRKNSFINKELVTSYFPTAEKIKVFMIDQINYQRELNAIMHLLFEEPDVSMYHTPGV